MGTTSKRIAATTVAIIAGLLSTGLAPTSAAARPAARDVQVVAHATNTLASATTARLRGADVLENDVQRTKDGRLVVLHDRSLAAMTNVEEVYPERAPWHVGDFTLWQIRRLTTVDGGRPLTLLEWAHAAGDRDLLVEVKTPGLYHYMARTLIDELTRYPVLRRAVREGRLTVISFDHRFLWRFARRSPVDVPVGPLWTYTPTEQQIAEQAEWADQIAPVFFAVTRDLVKQAHAHGLEVFPWTVLEEADMRELASLGVDGIITDRPVRLSRTLRALR